MYDSKYEDQNCKHGNQKPEPAALQFPQEPNNVMANKLLSQIMAAAGEQIAISVPTMAKLLSISNPTAYQLVKRTDFPVFTVGSRKLVSVVGLLEWVQSQTNSHGT